MPDDRVRRLSAFIRKELIRQSNEERATSYVDADDAEWTLLDGRFDIDELAKRIIDMTGGGESEEKPAN